VKSKSRIDKACKREALMIESWRITNSETVIKDRWIDLRADSCVTPSGVDIAPYYVLAYPDWVHVVAVTPDDQIVLVRQYRHGVGKVLLELPAGTVETTDASIEQTARRELEEETGYHAASWRFVSTLYPNPSNQTNRLHVFLGLGATRVRAQKLDLSEEGMEVVTIPIADVLSGLHDGLLGQAFNVTALLLALTTSGHVSLTAA
jgi:8-oxo-dGTP pyrophosphatase MutT (NUDIX family)